MLQGPFRVTFRVAEILEDVGAEYFLGGSLASSVFGEPRTTHGIDIVADLREKHVSLFLKIVHGEFYAPEGLIREAVRERFSFNLIHLQQSLKVDFYLLKDEPFAREQMSRRVRKVLGEADGRAIWVASPEDVILSKLRWFRAGHEASSQQWRDVLGVVKQQAKELDRVYLRKQAGALGLLDLWARAQDQAGISPPPD